MESTERSAIATRSAGVASPLATTSTTLRSAVDLFNWRVAQSGSRTCFRSKIDGAWRSATWNDWTTASREIAAGLAALGVEAGDHAAILANTRAEWMHADVGILMAGGVTVPIYQSNLPHECEYILNDSGCRVAFVENPLQIEKLVAERAKLGELRKVIYFDDRATLEKPDAKGRLQLGLDDVLPSDDGDLRGWIMSLSELREAGRAWLREHPGALEARWEQIGGDTLVTIVYTSGTTGPPKGVMLTHEALVWTCNAVRDVLPFTTDDEQLLFLPLAHIFAKILEWATVQKGARIAFAESIAQLVPNLAEVRPSFMAAVPRVFEKVYVKIRGNRDASPPTKQKIFDWALSVGRKVSSLQQRGLPIPLALELKRRFAHKLVFSKIHAVLGGRIQFMVSGGAPLSREIAEFFHATGLLILEGYGLTETTAASCVNRPERYRFGTVGPAVPGLDVKIAEDGEILLRAPSVFKGYYKQPEASAAVLEADGEGGHWFHTGDIGVVDEGFLRITDRKKDIIVTAGGKNVAPQNLENGLKTTPYISQVMVHGDKRPFLTALVTLNEENVRAWAEQQGLAFTDLADLSRKPEVRALIQSAVDALNAGEPSYATIKKFAILPQDFSQETGELTPTLKVKRKFATEKYKDILDGFYRG